MLYHIYVILIVFVYTVGDVVMKIHTLSAKECNYSHVIIKGVNIMKCTESLKPF